MASSGEPPAPSAATSSAISTSDDATSPAISTPDAAATTTVAKLLSTIKAVEKSAKFKTETAATFIEKYDFEGLEAYVVQTLTSVQGTEQHHHPGILCSLYQAQISYLVREGWIGDAETVLNKKVKPLLDNGDHFYRPKNLEDQVREAEKCIRRVELPGDIYILPLLLDYFGLYFPSSLIPDIERTASVFDFVAKGDVNGVQETRCLACQWIVPHGLSEEKLTKHYTGDGDGHMKCCFHVTQWMLSFLDAIKTEAGAWYIRNPFDQSVVEAKGRASDKRKQNTTSLLSGRKGKGKSPGKKKRQTSSLLSGGNFIMTELFIDKILDLHTSICKLPFYLVKEEEEIAKAAASKVRKTLLDMQKFTSDLISFTFKSVIIYDTLDLLMAISKFTALAISADDLLMPLLSLQHSKSNVQELYHKALNLRSIIVLVDGTCKKSKVVVSDEGSSTCDGSVATPTS